LTKGIEKMSDSREAFELGRDEYYRGEGNGAFDGFVAWDAAWQHQQTKIDALEARIEELLLDLRGSPNE